MKICKKTITIFLTLIILLYSIIPPKTAYAEENGPTLNSSGEAGQIIAQFAYDMVLNHANETIYDFGSNWSTENHGRIEAEKGNKVTGYAQGSQSSNYELRYAEDKYFMDCVGFVSFCIHHSLNIDGPCPPDHVFVAPRGIRSPLFEDVTGKTLQPGDIIYYEGHVMIYLGINGQTFAESSDVNNPSWQIKFRDSWPLKSYRVARIRDSAATQILRSNTKTSWDGQGTSGGIITPIVDDSKAFAQYINSDNEGQIEVNGRNNSSSFYYNGTPKKGEYLGKVKGNWLFNTLNDAADWLLGILTMGIKIQLVGWASIFEGLANDVVEGITDIELLTERVTVEDIIYNRIPILDVNLFNFENAGGYDLESTDLIYNLRMKIAQWYVAIRTICIILLLFTLIYLGIRTAIASVAKEKSEYKQKLVSWVVSFLIVMFIHYFMILILNFNEIAIGWITPPEDSTSVLYEQMRSYAYEIPATKGWTGAIIYVFLVYYLIKMLFLYFKRVLIVYILAILSPAMGIAYSIQRINGKSKALGVWVKEFSFNVIIQFIHALIYTIMMGLILGTIADITAISLIPYTLFLFVILNFILDVEDIIKNIFQIKANSLKSIIQTMFSLKNRFLPAVLIGGAVYRAGKSAVVNAYEKNLTNSLNLKYDQYKVQGNDEVSQSINKEIERLKQQEKDHIMQLNKASIDFAKSKLKGTVALVTAVPAVFEKPIVGAATFAYTAGALGAGFEGSGSYEKQAEALDKSTDGKNYIYIDDPNKVDEKDNVKNENAQNGNNQNGNTEGSNNAKDGTNVEKTEQKTIRTYNTAKNKTYKFPKAVLRTGFSLATAGTSQTVEETVRTAVKEHRTLRDVYSTRIEKLSVIGKLALKEVNTINKEVDRIKNRKLSANIL